MNKNHTLLHSALVTALGLSASLLTTQATAVNVVDGLYDIRINRTPTRATGYFGFREFDFFNSGQWESSFQFETPTGSFASAGMTNTDATVTVTNTSAPYTLPGTYGSGIAGDTYAGALSMSITNGVFSNLTSFSKDTIVTTSNGSFAQFDPGGGIGISGSIDAVGNTNITLTGLFGANDADGGRIGRWNVDGGTNTWDGFTTGSITTNGLGTLTGTACTATDLDRYNCTLVKGGEFGSDWGPDLAGTVYFETWNIDLVRSVPTGADKFWECGDGQSSEDCWSATSGGPLDGNGQPVDGDSVNLVNREASDITVNYDTTTSSTPTLNTLIIDATGGGTMTLNQADGIVKAQTEIVGDMGRGAVIQTGGTHRTGRLNYLILGNTITGEGDFLVSDTASLSVSRINVGNYGTGVLNIQNGGTASSLFAFLGREAGSTGTVTVDGPGSTFAVDVVDQTSGGIGSLFVGDFGNGTLNILNGGTVSSGSATVARLPSSTGTVTVDGAGSNWNIRRTLGVGVGGAGILNITNGGTVTNSGAGVGANGTVTVDGIGSVWDNRAGGIDLRRGALNILNGGRILSSNASLGTGGVVTVDGTGSTWINDTFLFLGAGDDTNGTLNISDGGAVTTGNVSVGAVGSRSGSGSITVDGTGSTLSSSGITVENNGSLDIKNEGTVNLADHLRVRGSVNMSNGIVNAFHLENFGQLKGTGIINADVFNEGLVGPGQSPGVLNINGDFSQTVDGTLSIELGGLFSGAEYDVLNVSGNATLAGILDVDLFDLGSGLFTPSLGSTFDILTAETLFGEFDILTLATLGNGLDWELNYLVDEFGTTDVLRLSVVSAVPVPAAVWLFGSGLFALMGVAKRKAINSPCMGAS